MISEGLCFFGRQRSAFFAALNWACLAARISSGETTTGVIAAGFEQMEVVPCEIPVRGSANDWTKAIAACGAASLDNSRWGRVLLRVWRLCNGGQLGEVDLVAEITKKLISSFRPESSFFSKTFQERRRNGVYHCKNGLMSGKFWDPG